ncbi:hypothetical protein RICGR_0474 [Rickettsiella grylli]|uniref:Uncharacterized protein n=1 Tax=Rickettsiella grylli TaxID=59196 RepID=A8PLM2_9COXI|nr:hypothetical protein RICGR_0474 [Rickettsiella grylli]
MSGSARYKEDLKIAKKILARGYEYGAIKDLLISLDKAKPEYLILLAF